jgi:hypothetical protein
MGLYHLDTMTCLMIVGVEQIPSVTSGLFDGFESTEKQKPSVNTMFWLLAGPVEYICIISEYHVMIYG